MAAKEPCPHPERGGHHEWYLTTTPKYGGIILCRACGKVKIRPGDTGCAVCGGPIERDRKNFDVCASCDDSEPCDHSGGELTADRATGEETCGDCGRQPMAAKEPTVERSGLLIERRHTRIWFGEGDQRWSVEDPCYPRIEDEFRAATDAKLYYVRGLASTFCYLVGQCPTTARATEQLALVRRALRTVPNPYRLPAKGDGNGG